MSQLMDLEDIQPITVTRKTLPWEEVGHYFNQKDSLKVWAKNADLDWRVLEAPVQFLYRPQMKMQTDKSKKVLIRSDTGYPLSIVSKGYKVVQPEEILNFFSRLINDFGYFIYSAGTLQNGRKIWILAETGKSVNIFENDKVQGYLLLTTSYDTSFATTAMFTTVRLTCGNTLNFALRSYKGSKVRPVKISHKTVFSTDEIHERLGIINHTWSEFSFIAEKLANRKISTEEAFGFLNKVFSANQSEDNEDKATVNTIAYIYSLYNGNGMGSNLTGSQDTLWGLVNAITEYYDHHRKSKSPASRLNALWFGEGARIKRNAWHEALRFIS